MKILTLRELHRLLRSIELKLIPRDWNRNCEWSKYVGHRNRYPRGQMKKDIVARMKELENYTGASAIGIRRAAKRILEILA